MKRLPRGSRRTYQTVLPAWPQQEERPARAVADALRALADALEASA